MTDEFKHHVPAYEDPLEQLFLEAQIAGQRIKKEKRHADPAQKHQVSTDSALMRNTFRDPENWERTRGIALIDKNTNTLVGNFSEYTHRFVPRTRKLLREHSPIPVDATEYCDGYLGFELTARFGEFQKWTQVKHAIIDIVLGELQLAAVTVEVEVALYLGGITRVDLNNDTQFASEDGEEVVFLPRGTNVLPHMTHECKLDVREAIGR